MRLTTRIHDRDAAGLTYVYPVVSRRARGVSVGINLNPNNACNFRCVYCQVPGLVHGAAPEIDLLRLESELREMLEALTSGDYMERHVPEGSRVLRDIAFSGNGEPTSSRQFDRIVELTGGVLADFGLAQKIDLVLITNGSLTRRPEIQRGLQAMAPIGGRVWFKLDSATEQGQARINEYRGGMERLRANLVACAAACPTWLQTCCFAWNGAGPDEAEQRAYLALVESLVKDEVGVRGVMLYGLARQSHQPEAPELSALPRDWMEAFAARVETAGLPVQLDL